MARVDATYSSLLAILSLLRQPFILCFLAAIVPLVLCHSAPAVETTWTFDGDGNWTESGKWSNGEPTDDTFDVMIDDGDSATSVTLNVTRTIGGLSLGADDTLQIQSTTSSGIRLTVANGFTNDGDILLNGFSGIPRLAVTSGPIVNSASGLIHFQSPGSGPRVLEADLTNQGTVVVDRETSFNKTNGVYANYGQFTVSNALFTVFDATFDQIAGSLIINGTSNLSLGTTLNLTGGNLNLAAAINVDGAIEQTGGTLAYSSGVIAGSGSGGDYNLLGGTVSGVPVLREINLRIGTGVTDFSGFVLEGSSTLELDDGIIEAGKTFTVRNTSFNPRGLSSDAMIENRGSLLVTGTGSGAASLTIGGDGLVNEIGGLLHFQSGGTGERTFVGGLANWGTVLVDRSTTLSDPDAVYRNHAQVTLASGQNLSVTGGGNFIQENGTLDVGTSFKVTGSSLAFNGGTISGTPLLTDSNLSIGSGNTSPLSVIFEGTSSVTLADNVLTIGQTLTARRTTGTQQLTFASGFTNSGSVALTGSTAGVTSVQVNNGALNNSATGLVHFVSGGGTRLFGGNLTNQGTVQVDQATTFSGGVFDQAGGTINGGSLLTFNTHTFQYNGGTIFGTPRFRDATLAISSGVTNPASFQLDGNNTLVLPDNVLPAGQTLTVRSSTTLESATLTTANWFTNHGTILLTGVSSGIATLATTSGTVVNSASGILKFDAGGSGTRGLISDLVNHGTIEVNQFTRFLKSGGVYTNNGQFTVGAGQNLLITPSLGTSTFEQADGTLDVMGTLEVYSSEFRYTGGTINGTIELRSGSSFHLGPGVTSPFALSVKGISSLSLADNLLSSGQAVTVNSTALNIDDGFTNRGSVVLNGTLYSGFTVSSGTLVNDAMGTFRVTAPSTINTHLTNNGTVSIEHMAVYGKFQGLLTNNSQFTIASGLTFDFGSEATFEQAGGTLDILGNWNQFSGKFTYTGGTINGTVVMSDSTLEIGAGGTGAASFLFGGAHNSLIVSSGGIAAGQVLTLQSSSPFNLNVASASGFTNNGSILLTSKASNESKLTITSGTLTNGPSGLLHFQTSSPGPPRNFSGNLINNGTVIVDKSTNFSKPSGTYTNNGQFTVASGATLSISGFQGGYSQTGGTTTVNGMISQNPSMTFAAGRLTGSGTISSDVLIQNATVEPGQSVGTLSTGRYTQQAGGTLVIEIGGTGNGQFDRLSSNTKVNLDGTLDVRLVDLGSSHFTPQAGDVFTFLTSVINGLGGRFSDAMLPSLGTDLAWKLRYTSSNVSLLVTAPWDFNADGVVSTPDYIVWRDTLGQSVAVGTGADANFDGEVTPADFEVWRAHFGESVMGSATGALFSPVPEPGALAICLIAIVAGTIHNRGRSRCLPH